MSHLLTYLQQVQKLEMDRYVCEKANETYRAKIQDLHNELKQVPTRIDPDSYIVREHYKKTTELRTEFIAQKEKKEAEAQKSPSSGCGCGCGCGFITLIVSYIVLHILLKTNIIPNTPFIEYILGFIPIILGIIAFVVSIAAFKIYHLISLPKKKQQILDDIQELENNYKNQTQEIDSKYENECASQISNLQKTAIENNNHLYPLIEIENQNIARTNEMINQIDIALNTAYSVGIIPQKYRALVPVTMFCEYIENGRCETLSGHEGAINLYENELRQNLIISKLDTIRSGISSLADNQFRLYQSLNSANTQIANLTDAYNTQNALISHNASVAQHQTDMLLSIEREKVDAIKRIEPLLGG